MGCWSLNDPMTQLELQEFSLLWLCDAQLHAGEESSGCERKGKGLLDKHCCTTFGNEISMHAFEVKWSLSLSLYV